MSGLSKINEAGNQVLRIGSLWNLANEAATSGKLSKWNAILERIWSELSADADKTHDDSDDKKKTPTEKFNEINIELNKLQINFPFSSLAKSKRPRFFNKILDAQYKALMEKDAFLRALQNAQGKGTLYKDEFEDDFE